MTGHLSERVEDVIAPFRAPREQVGITTEFRSTWLTASLDGLRERGYFDRYLANLPREHHDAIVHSIAGVWLPAAVCVAHYKACDALGLSTADQIANGRAVFARLQKTIFSVGFRAAREAGVTPWNVLKVLPAVFHREWRGGGCGIFKMGPKDARIELIGFPCAAIPYARIALRGVAMAMCELVCEKAYAQDIRYLCTETSIGYRVAWA